MNAATRPLSPDGKPMLALRALAKTNPAEPLTEYGVYLVVKRAMGPSHMTSTWHGALRTLVDRGLAERGGRRGGYEWWITDAGREALRAHS